jgi:hypothetical protein
MHKHIRCTVTAMVQHGARSTPPPPPVKRVHRVQTHGRTNADQIHPPPPSEMAAAAVGGFDKYPDYKAARGGYCAQPRTTFTMCECSVTGVGAGDRLVDGLRVMAGGVFFGAPAVPSVIAPPSPLGCLPVARALALAVQRKSANFL